MRLYYGWVIVALSIIAYIFVIGTVHSSFSIFVVPVSNELQLSRAEMNTVLVLLSAGAAIFAPFVGRMVDRMPARLIMIAGTVLVSASIFALSLSRSPLLSALIIAVPLALGYVAAGSLTMTVLIARWFVAQRARAMALSTVGMSLAGICMPPLVGFLVEQSGWRLTLAILAVTLAVVLLLLTVLVRERPGPKDLEKGWHAPPGPLSASQASTAPASKPPASVAGVLSKPHFWALGGGVAIMLGVLQALSISMVPLAVQSGLSLLQSTTLLTLFGAGGFGGMLLFAAVGDRVDRLHLLIVLCLVIALINAVLLTGDGYTLLATCVVALGLASGPVTPAFFALLADRFGTASFGTVRGLMTPLISVVGMIALRLAGEIFDRTGGYAAMFAGSIAVLLLAALFLLLGRPRIAPAGYRTVLP